jgi:Tfp pilus assembly protein PilV
MKHQLKRQSSRGTSLVEALVALAVMAFGMLAVLGIQATLRSNSDVSKQRSEAVRIAQETMESARAFSTIDTTGGQVAYADIAVLATVPVVGYTTNTTFAVSQAVVPRTNPDRKELRIRVDWTDRNGDPQRVELNGIVGANDPRVSLALGAQPKGIPERQPWGRQRGIPPQAKGIGGGLSVFKPPVRDTDNGSIVWVINDLTGLIVGICDSITTRQEDLTATDVENCNNTTAQILSGYVRFSTDLTQPTAEQSENPTSTALNLSIGLDLTSTGHPWPYRRCFDDAPTTEVAAALTTVVRYYCAVYSNTSRVWSGTSTVLPRDFNGADLNGDDYVPWVVASDADDAAVTRYRVCRYTPATSDAQDVPNRQHPRTYTNVTALEPLTNQNFLVIRAGDGTVPFQCPTDVAADPAAGNFVNSNTLTHQPPPS